MLIVTDVWGNRKARQEAHKHVNITGGSPASMNTPKLTMRKYDPE